MSDNFEHIDIEDDQPTDALNAYPESRIPFSREDLKNAESLRTSDYKPIALGIINNAPFTMEYKQALARWAHRSFTKDIILANNDVRKMGILSKADPFTLALETARLDLMKCRLSRSKSDTLEPASYTIEDDLIFVFTSLLSRTYGPRRERLINSVLKTESETVSRTGMIEQKNEDKKSKGWFSRK